MLLPSYVTKRNVHRFIDELLTFDGIVFVPSHQAENDNLAQRLSDEMCQEIIDRLPRELESINHIWIETDNHGKMYSFLHAQTVAEQEAQVDFLCALRFAYNQQVKAYEGFGEFVALVMELEKRGIVRFSLPLVLDTVKNIEWLNGEGWFEGKQGMYQKKVEAL
jgi:hypothetical protein